jgi:hypothetical protein
MLSTECPFSGKGAGAAPLCAGTTLLRPRRPLYGRNAVAPPPPPVRAQRCCAPAPRHRPRRPLYGRNAVAPPPPPVQAQRCCAPAAPCTGATLLRPRRPLYRNAVAPPPPPVRAQRCCAPAAPCTGATLLRPRCALYRRNAVAPPLRRAAPLLPPQALHHTRIEGALRINARKGATTLRTLNNHPIPLV